MAMKYIVTILPGKTAFGKTQIMNRIEQICFAHPIPAAYTHDSLTEMKLLMEVVFELVERYGTEKKAQEFFVCNLKASNIDCY